MQLHSTIKATDLLTMYNHGYVHGSIVSKTNFLDCLFSKPVIFNDSFLDNWLQTKCSESASLRSTGSTTGVWNRYRFGPSNVIVDIEKRQKSPQGDMAHLVGTLCQSRCGWTDKTYKFLYGGNDFGWFVDIVKNKCHLLARPYIWLYLLSKPQFVDLLSANRTNILSVVSSDWEPFFNQHIITSMAIIVNDCMIDWTTGLNFYRCKAGQYHTIPMFFNHNGIARNWLNLNEKKLHAAYDTATTCSRFEHCSCGSMRSDVKITTRNQEWIDLHIPELLLSSYRSLQFIRHDDKIHVFCSTEGDLFDHDIQVFEHKFGRFTLHNDKLAVIGCSKFPAFWDSKYGPYVVHAFDL